MFNPYYNPFSYIIEKRTGQFVGALCFCFALSFVPYLKIPFEWYSHFFHEWVQGIAALMLSGDFVSMKLYLTGGVEANFDAYPLWVVLAMGYIGNLLMAVLIYYAAEPEPPQFANVLTAFIIGMIAGGGFFFANEGNSILVAIFYSLLFTLIVPMRGMILARMVFKCAGLYMLLLVFKLPVDWIVFHHPDGDAQQLSNITVIPAMGWVIAWIAAGTVALRFLWVSHCVKGW